MKLDEILNSQKASTPVASTVKPVTQKSGILKLSDILSQQPSTPSPVQEVAPTPLPTPAPVKPTFKTYKDLTLKQKAKAGLDRLGLNVGASIGGVIASTVEALSTGKDVVKGAVTGSTISEELAKDSGYDKVVKDVAKNIQTYTQDSMKNTLTQKKIELGLDPNDTFTDQAFSGLGSFMGFVGPGMASKALVTTLGFVKYAPTVTSSLNIANESIVESQDVYKEEKEKGKSDQEAYESFRNTLASNALLIGVSNKLGGMFDNTTFTGLKRAFKAGFAGFMEGSQEAIQQIVSNVNTGKPWSLGVKDSFIIGAILGAPANLALDTGDKTKKEAVKQEIAQMDIADDKKQLAIDVIDGVATEEQKAKVVTELIANTESNIPVDETNKTNLQEDIKSMIEQGANVGDIVIALQEEGISQNDAENLVAEVIATPEQVVAPVEEIKEKVVIKPQDLKDGTYFENVGTLQSVTRNKKGIKKYYFSHPDGTQKYYTEKQALELVRKGYNPKKEISVKREVPQTTDKARQYGFDQVQYYFDETEAPQIVNYITKSGDQVAYRTSTSIATVPEHLRSRKLFNEVEPYWYKQERPENPKNTKIGQLRQELYDYLTKDVEDFAKEYQKRIDEKMALDQAGDGLEFKARKETATREMQVLEDFKKRYKVDFPVVIVDKIIQGQKTKLSADRTALAEGVTDGNTIAIAFDAVVNTAKHELVHLTLNNLDQIPELARFTREDILKAQAEKMGEKFTENKAKDIEEQLALDFEAYQNKEYKPNNSILAKFFASIDKMIKNFRNVIVKSNGDVITQYYDAILYGETARKEEVAIATESSVTKYLIDGILDYTPMYQTRRVLSLSNGITSVDFKSKETDTLSEEALKYKSADEFIKAQGTPVYHGTNATFTEFDPKKIGVRDSGFFGKGFYFATTKGEAKTYGKNVMEVYLDIKNPFDFSSFANNDFKGSNIQDGYQLSKMAEVVPDINTKLKVSIADEMPTEANDYARYVREIPFGEYDSMVKMQKLSKSSDKYYDEKSNVWYYTYKDIYGKEQNFKFYGKKQIPDELLDYALFNEKYKVNTNTNYLYGVEKEIADNLGESFTNRLKKLGYDSAIQSPEGDEYVAFYPEQIKTKQQLIDIWNKAQEAKSQPKFKEALDKSLEVYKESGDLTTKILKDLEGKTTVSKQYILDATNRGDVKQVEKNIIRDMLFFEGDKVNVKDFAFKVQQELLPLFRKDVGAEYENITLQDDLRGRVENYFATVYESPIKTSAGDVHFSNVQNAMGQNEIESYFGHTRTEDMADKKLRRVIEVQSDLYQKGNLERETPAKLRNLLKINNEEINSKARIDEYGFEIGNTPSKERIAELKANNKEIESQLRDVGRLDQYNDPTAHFRMIREEIRTATQDGKSVLQFPTGNTAMAIEGLAGRGNDNFISYDESTPLKTTDIERGFKFNDQRNRGLDFSNFIIVEKTGKDTFKAMPITNNSPEILNEHSYDVDEAEYNKALDKYEKENKGLVEEFSIAEDIDTNNPIYKFYEKEVGRYLKNNYKAETVTDDKGVTWYEVKLKDEYKGAVVAFKERVTPQENEEYIKKTYPKYYAMSRAKIKKFELKRSRAFERAKARLQEQYQMDTNYTTVKIADEMAKAMEVVSQNPDYAKQVALGLAEPPVDVTDTAISLALAEQARDDKDYKLQADAERERSLRQSRRGQEIVMEKGRVDENSSAYFIKQVLERRKELIAQKYKPFMKEAKPFLTVLDEVKNNKMKKNKRIKTELELKIEDFDSFLTEMAC